MVKINSLDIENVKKIKAVQLTPSENGLTVIGGRNGQGKTSVLDSIAWALGGEKYRPSKAEREDSVIPPSLKIELSNGLIVERKGKNSDLRVTDANGNKGGQQLLNEFVEQFALDLPKFMESTSKEKANTLLKVIGLGDIVYTLEQKEKELYSQRHAIGQIQDQKSKFAKEMTLYDGVPKELVSATSLIQTQQEILARNGENQKKRENLSALESQRNSTAEIVAQLEAQLVDATSKLASLDGDIEIAKKTALDLQDESTAELEASITTIEETNLKIRANQDRTRAVQEAQSYADQYLLLTKEVEEVRTQKMDLLKNANLPLPELSVEDGELTYKGYRWDNMSGADQLKVSTAIVRTINPKCGFVLLDKLEQMDVFTLKEFGEWLDTQNLQAIATRVSTGDECTIIIEDGNVESNSGTPAAWKEGEF